ncbi:MAG: hypothetical protein KDK36_20035 [Leptospiraceae bacterium]|nr:hypothetical protein [Leptospiraceae bacterium]
MIELKEYSDRVDYSGTVSKNKKELNNCIKKELDLAEHFLNEMILHTKEIMNGEWKDVHHNEEVDLEQLVKFLKHDAAWCSDTLEDVLYFFTVLFYKFPEKKPKINKTEMVRIDYEPSRERELFAGVENG